MSGIHRTIRYAAGQKAREVAFYRAYGYSLAKKEIAKEIERQLKKEGLKGWDLQNELLNRVRAYKPEKPAPRSLPRRIFGDLLVDTWHYYFD